MNSGDPVLPVADFSTHMGGKNPLPSWISKGLYGAKSGAKSAKTAKMIMTIAPAIAALFLRSLAQASRHKERGGRARVNSAESS
jgi:hypothetical protein